MKKKLTMALLTAGIMAMICTGCGNKKNSDDKDSGKDTKVTTIHSDKDEETEDTDETEKETTVDESEKEDLDWAQYYNTGVNYYLPYMHNYSNTLSEINDSEKLFFAMSINFREKFELGEIIEKHREALGKDIIYGDVEERTYNIEKQENYTTKNGIDGIKYEGTLEKDGSDPLWFYSFCFNSDEYSYQYIGFSSEQLTQVDESAYNLEEVKSQIKEIMDKSIDTITIEE